MKEDIIKKILALIDELDGDDCLNATTLKARIMEAINKK